MIIAEHSFHHNYTLGKQLGNGAYGVVNLATDRVKGNVVAVKCVPHKSLDKSSSTSFLREVEILKSLNHPHIVKFIDFFSDDDTMFFLCLEYAPGGELFDRIILRDHYSEETARTCIRNTCRALQYCHERDIIHRDIKPENILLVSDLDDTDIRIADFGLAVRVPGDAPLLTYKCGTVGYAAPEIFNGEPYGKAVDMYALGAVAYGLIGGYPPFDADTDEEIIEMSRVGRAVFHSPYWDEVSPEAMDFIGRLLSSDPSSRLTAQQALEHEWLTMCPEKLGVRDITNNIEKLKSHKALKTLCVAVQVVVAADKFKNLRRRSLDTLPVMTDRLSPRSAAARPHQLDPLEAHMFQAGLQAATSDGAILKHMSSSGESEFGDSCATSSKSLQSPRKLPELFPCISPLVLDQAEAPHYPLGCGAGRLSPTPRGVKMSSRRADIISPVVHTLSVKPTNFEELTGKFINMQSQPLDGGVVKSPRVSTSPRSPTVGITLPKLEN